MMTLRLELMRVRCLLVQESINKAAQEANYPWPPVKFGALFSQSEGNDGMRGYGTLFLMRNRVDPRSAHQSIVMNLEHA